MKDSGTQFLKVTIAFFMLIGALMVMSSFNTPEPSSSAYNTLNYVTSRDGMKVYTLGDAIVVLGPNGDVAVTR